MKPLTSEYDASLSVTYTTVWNRYIFSWTYIKDLVYKTNHRSIILWLNIIKLNNLDLSLLVGPHLNNIYTSKIHEKHEHPTW